MNKTFNILVIGSGNIGRRHLESLVKSNQIYCVDVLDKSQASLEKAKILGETYNTISIIEYHKTFESLKENYDMAIIATNSDVRFSVLNQVIKKTKVKNILLEKFIFQTPEDYSEADHLFKSHNINVWVNCNRRTWKLYNDLKTKLKGYKENRFSIYGTSWGLASNGIHFIDLFCWLAESENLSINTEHIYDRIYLTKRQGFIEFYGTLTGKINNCEFSMNCLEGHTKNFIIEIHSEKHIITIDEKKQWMVEHEKTISSNIYKKIQIPNVSDLTANICNDIITNQSCKLPTYKESSHYHLLFLNQLIKKVDTITGTHYNQLAIT